jgi:Zn-dependent protease with chaperone function
MLIKPFIFVMTFVLSIVNLMILLVPLELLFWPMTQLFPTTMDRISLDVVLIIIFTITSYMIGYLLLDLVFGFTVRSYDRTSEPFDKVTSIPAHQDISDSFKWLQARFKMKNVRLRIDEDMKTVNAYAIGSLRKKTVTLTMGLINKMHKEAVNKQQYLDAVRGIMAHEMSHLANKDFLPAFLLMANEGAIDLIKHIIYWVFRVLTLVLRVIPFLGRPLSALLTAIYNLVDKLLTLSFQLLFMPIYNFLQKILSRSVEFRCDRDAAYAFGGHRIAAGLSMLGPGAYFSVFSTHPRTKTRIHKVERIQPKPGYITVGFLTKLMNVVSVGFVFYVWYMTAKVAPLGHILNGLEELGMLLQ